LSNSGTSAGARATTRRARYSTRRCPTVRTVCMRPLVKRTFAHSSIPNCFGIRRAGIILVHDLTNRKSYRNLWKWLDDVQTAAAKAEGRDFELTVPMLLVGTKADLLSDRNRAPRRAAMAEELNCPAIEVVRARRAVARLGRKRVAN